MSIEYSKCVSVALVFQHAKRLRLTHCHLCPVCPSYFSKLSHKRHDLKTRKLLNKKCVFWFSLQILSETLHKINKRCTWGDPNIPGIVKKNYSKYLYKFETLFLFEERKYSQGPPANRWWPLTVFPMKILDNVSSIGSGAGIAASARRGSTSKGTKVSNFYKYFE